MALPMIREAQFVKLKLLFKPEAARRKNCKSLLVLYLNNFALVLDELGRIELRYFSSSSQGEQVIRVIGSRDVELNKWNELIITDASTDNQLLIKDDNINRIILVTPERIPLKHYLAAYLKGELFIGGLPAKSRHDAEPNQLNSLNDDDTFTGFAGCIKEFSINERHFNLRSDLNGDTLDGFDIGK